MQSGTNTTRDAEPLSIMLTLSGKRQVLDKYLTTWFGGMADALISDDLFTRVVADKLVELLPGKLEDMGLETKLQRGEVHGLSVVLSMSPPAIKDLKTVLKASRKTDGEEFASTILALEPVLATLGMPEKFGEIKLHVAEQVHKQIALTLPSILQEKLAEMSIGSTIDITPKPEPDVEEPVDTNLQEDQRVMMWVNIADRRKVAEAAGGGVKGFAAEHISNPSFLNIIRKKLEDEVPDSITKKVGRSIQIFFQTKDDFDEGSKTKRTSFWIIATLHYMDIAKVLTLAKGEAFAEAFETLTMILWKLHQLGVAKIDTVLQQIRTKLDMTVLGNVRQKLSENIEEKLGATVRAVDSKEYESLRKFATRFPGRCCSIHRDPTTVDSDGYYWIPEDFLHGPGWLGRSGVCPALDQQQLCASFGELGGVMGRPELVKTHFAPFMSCFPDTMGLNAAIIVKKCG